MPYRPYVKNSSGSLTDLPLEAETSVKLKTARSIGLSGVTASAQSFDGSGNITIPVTAVPASLITGDAAPYSAKFTYVVDSNAKLAAWINNTSGNDYTSVLIKSGTWEAGNNTLNLTTTGTKVVEGEYGSVLHFTSATCVKYDALPADLQCYMKGVSLLVETTAAGYGSFQNIINMYNCYVHVVGSNGSPSNGIGFNGCYNLIECTGLVEGARISMPFSACRKLLYCRGQGTGTTSGYGFRACFGVHMCEKLGVCTTQVFFGCKPGVASTEGDIADTAAGGWNNTSNT